MGLNNVSKYLNSLFIHYYYKRPVEYSRSHGYNLNIHILLYDKQNNRFQRNIYLFIPYFMNLFSLFQYYIAQCTIF